MPEYLYKFRSTDKLLGDAYQELERQELYFAAPDRLNDPMEGFMDIYWAGDTIVWKNFLSHYLLCLERLCTLLLLSEEQDDCDISLIPVLDTASNLPTALYKELYQDIRHHFFSNSTISRYPALLARRSQRVRRNELIFHLRVLHFKALSAIFTSYQKHNLISDSSQLRQINTLSILDIDKLSRIDQFDQQYPGKHIAEKCYAVANNLKLQNDLILQYNNAENPLPQNRRLVFLEFPERYTKEIERIVYPEWYASSFVDRCNSSSMWGHYGDGHKGVCLKFKVTKENNLPFIKLYGITGWASSKTGSEPTLGYRNFQFRQIDYSGRYPEIDFFRSLGRLSRAALNEWYVDENGHKSVCADDFFKNENVWRDRYWNTFYQRISVKLADWIYENEYRLILSSLLMDYDDPENRKFKYHFKDLDGIIFGIKTSQSNKLKIASIIETKCRAEGRDDFKFYQAYYSKEAGQIEIAELTLLKFETS